MSDDTYASSRKSRRSRKPLATRLEYDALASVALDAGDTRAGPAGCPRCQQNRVPGWQNHAGLCEFHGGVRSEPDYKAAVRDLADALEEILAAVKTVKEMNHHRFDGTGIKVNNALSRHAAAIAAAKGAR